MQNCSVLQWLTWASTSARSWSAGPSSRAPYREQAHRIFQKGDQKPFVVSILGWHFQSCCWIYISAPCQSRTNCRPSKWAWKRKAGRVPTYLHQRDKDAAEQARSVGLNGFLQSLLIGCECQCTRKGEWGALGGNLRLFLYQTHQPDKQHSWLVFQHCFWWQGSLSEHVHLCLHPDMKYDI